MNIVLHICCGVCAAAVAERLLAEGHSVIGLFYNPNIHPPREYQKRLEAARTVAAELGFPLAEAPYTPQEWLKATEGLSEEPEGGQRCPVCFRIRLQETRRYMKEHGCDAFTSTLTVSPHKDADVINRIGRDIGGEGFLARDFKKRDGFRRAMELAEKWGLYRQDYCGCLYSRRDAES